MRASIFFKANGEIFLGDLDNPPADAMPIIVPNALSTEDPRIPMFDVDLKLFMVGA